MYIFIPIPIGTHHTSTVRETIWNCVSCEHCRKPYAYPLVLQAKGHAKNMFFLDGKGAANRAEERARENLAKQNRNRTTPIPCPQCGSYQEDMVRILKEEAWINLPQIVGTVLVLLSFVFLAFNVDNAWTLTSAFAVPGICLLAYGYFVAFNYDPNAGDPERRKSIGKEYALWGERLSKLRESIPDLDPT